MDKVNIDLGNVQKTLFLPLWGRAEESKKQKPMLIDETAIKIIDQVDFDFSQITQNIDELSQIAWIKRSLFCDRVIRIKIIATYYYFRTLRIGLGNLLMGLLSDYLGIQYMLHLKLGDRST